MDREKRSQDVPAPALPSMIRIKDTPFLQRRWGNKKQEAENN